MTWSFVILRLVVGTACAVIVGVVVNTIGVPSAALAQTARQAPFGDEVGPLVTHYNRARPHIATAGRVRDGAVPGLRALGFSTIVDLRGPSEGTGVARKTVEGAGLRYFNIPVTTAAPTDAQVAEFARIVENPKHAPLLIHCAAANRVGAMWALYRVKKGVPVAMALEEGRTIGMQPNREAAVRKRLGFPAAVQLR